MKRYDLDKIEIIIDDFHVKGFITDDFEPKYIELCFKKDSIAHDLLEKKTWSF